MTKRVTAILLAAALLATFSGCATIGGAKPTERIEVESSPAGADVVIDCDGEIVGRGVTPTAIAVPRETGDCRVALSKEGFATRTVKLEQGFNPMYWLNIPFMIGLPFSAIVVAFEGGSVPDQVLLGLGAGAVGLTGLIVDSVNDAKHDHDPKKIVVELVPVP